MDIENMIDDESVKRYKEIVFEILKDFSAFLKKKDIRFTLAYGTLLGSVRHQGFIPWDDDVDIIIPKDDVKRLLSIVKDFESDIYEVVLPYDDSKVAYSKVIKIYYKNACIKEIGNRYYTGPFIDVFVTMDYMQNCNMRFYLDRYRFLATALNIKHSRVDFKSNITRGARLIRIISCFMSKKYITNQLKRYFYVDNEENKKCIVSGGLYVFYNKEYFNDTIESEFEGELFPIPKAYDEFLRNFYGDYMILPPENKRVTKHIRYLCFEEKYNDKNLCI